MDSSNNENFDDANGKSKTEFIQMKENDTFNEINSTQDESFKVNQLLQDKIISTNDNSIINTAESEAGQKKVKQDMSIIRVNLNPFYIEAIANFGLGCSIIIYEALGLIIITSVLRISEGSLTRDFLKDAFDRVFNKLGLKWLFFITLNTHLSVGFFCLKSFAHVLTEIKSIKKFLLVKLFQVALFYGFSILFIKYLIEQKVGGFFHQKIDETKNSHKEEIHHLFYFLIDKASVIAANFLATFNTFLDELILGIMYIFLFVKPRLSKEKLVYFRFLALIPILYILASLFIRAYDNYTTFDLNIYVSLILLGPKVVIYLFFISTLLVIKYKGRKYNVFDSEGDISPQVFSDIGSKTFGLFGLIELMIGLFYPSLTPTGFGGKYLLVLCAPIMTLFDYKKKVDLKFPGCQKGNFSLFIKFILNFVLYFMMFYLGSLLLLSVYQLFMLIIKDLWEFLIQNIDKIGLLMAMILNPKIKSANVKQFVIENF